MHISGKSGKPAGVREETKNVGSGKGPQSKGATKRVGYTASENVGSLGKVALGPCKPTA
jgi:hypothetical protein